MTLDAGHRSFDERRIALEDAFFHKRDRELMEKLRGELQALESAQKLAHVSGIVEQQVLQGLVAAGVQAETLAAVTLIPLVEVAWCDGTVAPEERDAVLNAAVSEGIRPGAAPYALLEQWLQTRPDPQIYAAWKDYVHEMSRLMPKDSLTKMRKHVLERARRVAAAAGGFLGLATISAHEQAKLDEFEKAWLG
jgi:hypothetical protein